MHTEGVKPLSWFGTKCLTRSGGQCFLSRSWPTLLVLACAASSCRTSELGSEWPSQPLTVGAGPEDLVLDTFGMQPRLLVSCDARRSSEPPGAGIWSLDLASHKTGEVPRYGEPESFVFHPHGIDLLRQPLPVDGVPGQGEAVPVLYIISHDDERNVHSVLAYQVFAGHLQYLRSWTDPLLNSPNALTVLDDGTLLVTNDSGKRGSRLEALFKRKKSTVVAWNATENRWWVVADKLAYANGIVCRDNDVYVATTRQSRVFSYRWDGQQLLDQRELARIPGADNLRWDGNDLLVAGHPSILAFVRHAGSAKKKSPIEVWRLKVGPNGASASPVAATPSAPSPTSPGQAQAPERIYANDGSSISGAATALIWSGQLYLSQVFDPFVLRVSLP